MVPWLRLRIRRDGDDDDEAEAEEEEDMRNMTTEVVDDADEATSLIENVDVTSEKTSEVTTMRESEFTSTSKESLVVVIEERFGSKCLGYKTMCIMYFKKKRSPLGPKLTHGRPWV